MSFRKLLLYPSELRGHEIEAQTSLLILLGFVRGSFGKLLVDSDSGPKRAGGHLSYGPTDVQAKLLL
jgi:hypothetical protein